MIEMRWIFAPAGSGRGLLGGEGEQMHESVLQYRHIVSTAENTNDGVRFVNDWSEWKDVPTPYAAMKAAGEG